MITFRRVMTGIAASVLITASAGCGSSAGLGADPLTEAGAVTEGQTAQIRRIQVGNAFVLGPEGHSPLTAGDSAAVILTLVNNGPTDQLTNAHSDAADSVAISGGRITSTRGDLVKVGPGDNQITLRGLTNSLDAGSFVHLTLRFSNAGTIRMELPVLPRSGPYKKLPTPEPSPSPSPAAAVSPGGESSPPPDTQS
jgi:copper(I)-binding protein